MFSRPLFLQRRTAIFAVSCSCAGLLCAPAAEKRAATDQKKEPAAAAPAGGGGGAAAPEPSPQFRRAVGAMRAGQWKAARTAWEAVLRDEPANAAAMANLGKVLCQLQDYPAAQSVLEKATALKPSLSDSWLMLGQTWLARQSPMMAVSCMARGVAENPSDAGGHNSLAIALKQAGWTDAAEAELQKALDLNPSFGEAHFNLAVMYLERKPPSLEMGRRHYRRALELGAAPDALVEKQIQGESVITSQDQASDPANAATAAEPSPGGVEAAEKNPEPAPGPADGSAAKTTGTPEKNASASSPAGIAPVPPPSAKKVSPSPSSSSPAPSSPRSPSRKS